MVKEYARRKVRTEIEAGRLKKPKRCQICTDIVKPLSDGRSGLQAHHPDHRKPLLIKWLCPRCHRNITPLAIGEKNGFAKLNLAKVDAILELRKIGWPYHRISCLFDVTISTVLKVVKQQTWAQAITERNK